MKIIHLLYVLSALFLMGGCTPGKQLTELSQKGKTAFEAGDYEGALVAWEKAISLYESKGKPAKPISYYEAGKAALALAENDKAIIYFEKARGMNFPDAEMYVSLAEAYRRIDNLSREISTLESYVEKFPEGKELTKVQVRLFETYVESKNWDKAIAIWPPVKEESSSNNRLLEGYLVLNKELKNTEESQKTASQLIASDPGNVIALEWFAEHYFWKAENRYKNEMEAYEAHKTRSQYAKLLKALKVVSEDYKKSRDYYEKLYKISPSAAYAKYLKVIYTRLDDKQKAAYYDKRSK